MYFHPESVLKKLVSQVGKCHNLEQKKSEFAGDQRRAFRSYIATLGGSSTIQMSMLGRVGSGKVCKMCRPWVIVKRQWGFFSLF